ncbi:MAG: TonB-dependent receptor [Gammaproteobacteria bacterium]|nr:TonB-dependent receptor [Gammaproteobacteria bacterium]MDH3371824.1 TonB-dependent receptor [Gammaproteobacteria bacterium]
MLIGSIAFLLAVGQGPSPTAPTTNGDGEQDIEEIEIVATRLGNDIFALGEIISVNSADLAKARPVDPEQVLSGLPGFAVSRPGGPGGVSEIFFRGAESNFTSVYIDGIRLNNPSNTRGGSFDFSSLGAYDIDRIDIVAGAMSAIYGADAVAGVVRIRSAWARPGSPNVFFEAGSVDDWRTGAGVSFAANEQIEWSLRASTLDGGNEIEGSALRLRSFATRLVGQWPNGGAWTLSLRHAQRDRGSFPEVSGGPELAVSRELETADGDELSVAATSDWAVTPTWKTELHFSGSRIRDSADVPAVAPGVLDEQPAFSTITRYQRAQFLWVNRIELAAGLQLVAGTDLVAEQGSDKGAVDLGFAVVPNAYKLDRSSSSVFVEMGKEWNESFTTTLAMRWDIFDADKRLSGKFGIARAISKSGSRVWGSVASGFKQPSFFALGNPLFGNPDLVAEKVRSAEIGYTHVFDGASTFTLAAYKSRFNDLVDFDFESFTNINKGRIDISGIELRTKLQLSPTVILQLDGTRSNISSNSGPLRRRPERLAGASLDWSLAHQWQLNVATRYVGSRLITSIPTGDVDASAFQIVNATARYEQSPNRTFWIAMDNVLNEHYQDAPGFPSPGTRVRIGASLSF